MGTFAGLWLSFCYWGDCVTAEIRDPYQFLSLYSSPAWRPDYTKRCSQPIMIGYARLSKLNLLLIAWWVPAPSKERVTLNTPRFSIEQNLLFLHVLSDS